MSTPKYIINWEELLDILEGRFQVDINDIDLGDLENYLDEQIGKIIDLLNQILELLKDKGIQRVHSISYHVPAVIADYKLPTRFNEDVLITGITYSQSAWKYQDSWSLEVSGNRLFDEVGTKEIGESKAMNVFYFVPAGTNIDIIFHNNSGNSRLVWFDIQYIGLSMDSYIPTPEPTGMVVVNYITENRELIDSKTLVDMPYGTHVIKPDPIPGYLLVGPNRHSVKLSEMAPTVTIEFIVEAESEELPPIDNPYDWLVVMRWEDNTNTDLDLHCYFRCDSDKHIYYGNKELEIDENNKAWLNYDYTSHGPEGRHTEPEIISILGMENYTSNIYVTNFSAGNINENVIIDIFKRENNEDMKIDTVTILPSEISGQKSLYIGNIKNGEFVSRKQNISYRTSGMDLETCEI